MFALILPVSSYDVQTLDVISDILKLPNWEKLVPSLADSFPGVSNGNWKLGTDFLRIDGTTSGAERGDRVKEFNADVSNVRLFLISSRAGGIGINLCSANRVSKNRKNVNPRSRKLDLAF